MTKQFYITKTFTSKDVFDTPDEDLYIGKFTGFVSTTHKDRQGDILTKNFEAGVAENLKENTAVFYNHKTSDHPVGKILVSELRKMEPKLEAEKLNDDDNNHYGVYVEIGVSKTAETEWQLIKEGILNKFSIGGYLTDFEWSDKHEAFIVDRGEIFEASVVGVPANPHASIGDVMKTLRKDYLAKLAGETDKTGEIDMNEEELKSFIKSALDEQAASFNEQLSKLSPVDDSVVETEEDKLRKEIEQYKSIVAARDAEADKLKKEIAKVDARKTGASHTSADPHFIEDPQQALYKGLYEFGQIMKSGDEFDLKLIVGNQKNQFTDLVRGKQRF